MLRWPCRRFLRCDKRISSSQWRSPNSVPQAAPASLPHSIYVRLWSAIHNVNYASRTKAAEAYEKWTAEFKHAALRNEISEQEYISKVVGDIRVDNTETSPALQTLKRADPPKTVTTLQVKKKKKKTED